MTSIGDPAPAPPGKLTITKVVIDLTIGLFAFTYDDDITEHMTIRDYTDLPTVASFLAALTDEVATYGRPQRRSPQPEPVDASPNDQ